MAEDKKINHLPVMILIAIFAIVFLISMMLFQVQTTEFAVVKRFGKPVPDRAAEPGLSVKWPWPIEEVWTHDNRIQIFEGKKGVVEELYTKDEKTILVTLYVGWQVDKDRKLTYMQRLGTKEQAEEILTNLLREFKKNLLAQYDFSQLVNVDPDKVKIGEIEEKLLSDLQAATLDDFGIRIHFVGIKHIGLPEAVTQKVFERMKAERERIAASTLAEGDAAAMRIRGEADAKRNEIISDAEAKAQGIRAEADREAATSYEEFAKNPELALFLSKLESLRESLQGEQSTLVLDTNTPPFDVLKPEAINELQKDAAKNQADKK